MGELKRRIIAAMEPTEYELARRWIPVSERLPEEEQDVLVFTHEGKHVAALDEDGIWCPSHGDGWEFPNVTHWMPLPPEPLEVTT